MPYVGNPLANAFSSRVKQDLTGQSGTSFTLTHAVSSANDLSVYINHVRQEPTTAYTVDYNTLTTTGSVAGTDDFYIIYDELGLQSIAHDSAQAMKATSGTFTGAITTTQMASSGPVSGTTGTFSGAFTSPGIDDNANATAINIDSNENVGIGGTAINTSGTLYNGATLHLLQTASGASQGSQIRLTNATTGNDASSGFDLTHSADTGTYIQNRDSGPIMIYTGGSQTVNISSASKVGINTSSPQDPLHVYLASGQRVARFEANNATSAFIAFRGSNTSLMPAIGVKDEALFMSTNDAYERFRIKDNGRILIGDAGTGQAGASLLLGNDNEEGYGVSSSSSTQLKKGGKSFILKDGSNHSTDTNIFWSPRSTGWSMFYWNKVNDGGSDLRYVDLYFDGTSKGTIKYNSGTGQINYNTTSDYRLKDNIKDKDVASLYDDIKKIKVRTFKYKKDVDESADDTVGFIAHEVQEVFPQLCDTPKDAMKDNIEGRTPAKLPNYQDLDYGKFTPFIIGALQKAMEKIETLEAKVKALESK